MKVLLATDGLRPARSAAGLTRQLLDPSKVELTVLSVATYELFTPERPEFMFELLEERRAGAEAIAKSYADYFRKSAFAVTERIAEGSPGQRITEIAASERFDLVVVGAGRHSWLGNALLGSTSTHVLHSSRVSVLVVHDFEPHHDPMKILVATDGSRGAFAAVDTLAKLGDASRCEVNVVAVQPVPIMSVPPTFGIGPLHADSGYRTQLENTLAERAQRDLDRTIRRLSSSGFAKVRGSVAVGAPSEMILKEAEGVNADIVVVGSRGLGAVRRALMGSVSDHVSRHAPATLVTRSVESREAK